MGNVYIQNKFYNFKVREHNCVMMYLCPDFFSGGGGRGGLKYCCFGVKHQIINYEIYNYPVNPFTRNIKRFIPHVKSNNAEFTYPLEENCLKANKSTKNVLGTYMPTMVQNSG